MNLTVRYKVEKIVMSKTQADEENVKTPPKVDVNVALK